MAYWVNELIEAVSVVVIAIVGIWKQLQYMLLREDEELTTDNFKISGTNWTYMYTRIVLIEANCGDSIRCWRAS
jgi:hypothetical protein